MPITDYNKKKPLEVSSRNDSGTTQDKAQPIIVRQGAKLTGTTKSEADSGSTTTSRKEFATVLSLKKDALVTTVGFESNDNTDVTIKIQRNSDSKILAQKTVTPVAQSFTEVSFTAGDYTSFPSSGDTVNVFITESGTASLRSGSGGTRSNTLFDITNNDTTNEVERIAGTQNSNGGTAIQCETYESGASKTGTGDVTIDFTNISDAQDIAVYDQNGNLLDYEIESLDTAAETGVIWAYDNWVRDDSVQAQVAYGDNSANTDRQNVTGTWSNSGQNAVMVQHLQDDPLTATDSTSNNNDGTVNGAIATDSGQFDGAGSFDGTDDYIEVSSPTDLFNPNGFTLLTYAKFDSLPFDGFNRIIKGQDDADDNSFLLVGSNGTSDVRYQFKNNGNFKTPVDVPVSTGQFFQLGYSYDGSTLQGYKDSSLSGTSSVSVSDFIEDVFMAASQFDKPQSFSFSGDIDEIRIYSENKNSEWWRADYDASPKAGQVYFSQQAAEATTSTKLSGNVTVENNTQSGVEVVVYNKTQDKFEGLTSTDSNSDFSITVSNDTDEYYVGYFYDDGTEFYASGETTKP